MKFDRRLFLQFLAGASMGALTSGVSKWVWDSFQILREEKIRVPKGKEHWGYSLCRLCPGGCGLKVRMVDDRVVRVLGRSFHPINGKGLCPVGLLNPVDLYLKNRLTTPLKKTGKRFTPLSQQEVITTLKEKLQDKKGTWAWIGPEPNPLEYATFISFLNHRPGKIWLSTPFHPRKSPSLKGPFGKALEWTLDFENTHTLLFIGSGLFDHFASPPWIARTWGEKMPDKGMLLHIGPSGSTPARKASFHLEPLPGTEGFLLLGLMYIIINEKYYDQTFIPNHAYGFESFRRWLLNNFNLNIISEKAGVPVVEIVKIARLLIRYKPAVVAYDDELENFHNGMATAQMVHGLNALLGAINNPGGMGVRDHIPFYVEESIPIEPFPSNPAGEEIPSVVFLTGSPFPYLGHAHPGKAWLQQADLVIGMSTHREDFFDFCHYVLPLAHPLESFSLSISPPHFPHQVLSVASPLLSPGKEVQPLEKWMESLGALPVQVEDSFVPLLEEGGSFFGSPEEALWQETLQKAGLWSPPREAPETFWNRVVQRGGWWVKNKLPESWSRVFPNPHKAFQFDKMIPPQEPLYVGQEKRFPYVLIPLPFSTFNQKALNLPYMPILNYAHRDIQFALPVLMHPEEGAKLSLRSWDKVWVDTVDQSFKGIILLHESVRPEVVEVCFAPTPESHIGQMVHWKKGKHLLRCGIRKA